VFLVKCGKKWAFLRNSGDGFVMTVQTALSDSMGLIGVFEREEML
jgi:hypothetical protein